MKELHLYTNNVQQILKLKPHPPETETTRPNKMSGSWSLFLENQQINAELKIITIIKLCTNFQLVALPINETGIQKI